MNNVLAIIVTYNRKELLQECIKALLNQKEVIPDILVVDNASTDGTEKLVKDIKSQKIIYINTKSNLGGAGGFSFGIKYAMNLKYDYLWIMDDDTIPTSNALIELIKACKILNNNFGFLSSKVLWKDNSLCKMNIPECAKDCLEKSDLLKYGMLKLSYSSFVSCFIKSETVYKVGLPIKEFFIWGDDVEYTKRINKINNNSFFVNDSIVIHKMQKNETVDIVNETNKNRIPRFYNNYRNMFYIRKREGPKKICLYVVGVARDFLKTLFKSKRYRFRKSWMIFKGFLAGLFFDPKIEYTNYSSKKQ